MARIARGVITLTDIKDGDTGIAGARNAVRYLYKETTTDTAPDSPQATITWSTGSLSSITTGWSEEPPVVDATGTGRPWVSILTFHQASSSSQTTTTTATGDTPKKGFTFDGVVTFSNNNLTDGSSTYDPANVVNNGTTTIDGGKITANSITSLGAVTAGTFSLGSGAFSVNSSGHLVATDADISGNITASTLNVDGATISGELIADSLGQQPIVDSINLSQNSRNYIESLIISKLGASEDLQGDFKSDNTTFDSDDASSEISKVIGFEHGDKDVTLNFSFNKSWVATGNVGQPSVNLQFERAPTGTTSWSVIQAYQTYTGAAYYESETSETFLDISQNITVVDAATGLTDDAVYDYRVVAGSVFNIASGINVPGRLEANEEGGSITTIGGLEAYTKNADNETITGNWTFNGTTSGISYDNLDDKPTLLTQTDIDNSISALVDSAPTTLDTLNELAAALGDDANFAQTTATALGTKITQADGDARYALHSSVVNTVYQKEINTSSAGYVSFEFTGYVNTIGRDFYIFDVIGYKDFRDAKSFVHYTVYLNCKGIFGGTLADNTITADVIAHNQSDDANLTFKLERNLTPDNKHKLWIGIDEGYSGIQILHYPTYIGDLTRVSSADFDFSSTAPTTTTVFEPSIPVLSTGATFTGKVTIDNANGWDGNANGSNLLRLDGADGYPTLTFASDGTINWSLYKGGAGSWVGDGSIGFVTHSGAEDATRVKFKIDTSGNITALGTITASGYNNSNWNTAYTYSQVGHLPLDGGSMDGDINMSLYDITSVNNLTAEGVIRADDAYKVGTTTVIDSARNADFTNGTFTGDLTISSTSPEIKLVDTNGFTDSDDRIIFRASADNALWQWYDNSEATTTTLMTLDSGGDLTVSGDLTVGSNTTRKPIRVKSETYAEVQFFTNGTEYTRIGTAEGGALGTAEGDFYAYGVGRNKMHLIVPKDGSALKRENGTITIWDSSHFANNSSNWNTAYTYSQVGHLPLAGGTLTGKLTLSATNPQIDFNGTSDSTVDMAIRATPEGLDFLEPEQSGRIHFQILDDTGVNAPFGYSVGTTQVIDSSGNVKKSPTLTLSGDVSGTATFTDLGNATLTATVANDSHTHDGRYYTESESNSRFLYKSRRTGCSNAGAGWYRIARSDASSGRGSFQISFFGYGGTNSPQETIIRGTMNYGTTHPTFISIENANGSRASKVRGVQDDGKCFIEVYLSSALTNLGVECTTFGIGNFRVTDTATLDIATGTETSISPEYDIITNGKVLLGNTKVFGHVNASSFEVDGTRKDTNWDTAYGWGNHASAGYLTTHQDISGKANLSGATFTGNVTIEDSVLEVGDKSADNYVEIRQVYANDFGFTFQHSNASAFRNLQGSTNQVLVLGDVDNDNGTGTLLGVSVLSGGSYSKRLDLRGNGVMYIGSGTDRVFADNYHPNADKWTTARSHTVTLTGDVTGSATQSVDGTGNKTWSISTAVANDSHDHDRLSTTWQTINLNDVVTDYKLRYEHYSQSSTNMPASAPDNANALINISTHSGAYNHQLAFHSDEHMYYRAQGAGTWTGWRKMFHDDYHPNADKWTTARTNTVTLTGDASGSGSASVDGTGNWTVSVPVVVNNDSHTHDGRYVNVTGDTMSGALVVNNTTRLSGSSITFNNLASTGAYNLYSTRSSANAPPMDYGTMFTIGSNKAGTTFATQIAHERASNQMFMRGMNDGANAWTSWQRLFADNYHPNADKWTTARTITLGGDLSGSVSLDGSANVTLSAQVSNNSHSHNYIYADVQSSAPSGAFQYLNTQGNSDDSPSNDWYNTIRMGHGDPNTYYNNTLAVKMTGSDVGGLWGRTTSNGTKGSWRRFFADDYHPNADKWTTARTLSLTGDVTGSVSWDGSANASITATVVNDSHNHNHSDGDFTVNGSLIVPSNIVKFANLNDSITFEDTGNVYSFNTDGGAGNAPVRAGSYQVGTNTVIDSSRNLTNMVAGSFSSYVSANELRANSYMLQDGVKEVDLGTFNFYNSDPNNFIDIIFTTSTFWGIVEVEITSSYSYQNACGSLVKRFAVGHNTGSSSYGEGSEELISDTGPLSNSIRIGSIERKGTTFVVPINKFTTTNNNFEVRVKMFSLGHCDNTTVSLGSKYSGTNLVREYVPFKHVVAGSGSTTINSQLNNSGRLRVSGGNNTDGNAQSSTGAVIGTYVDQYAFIDLASSNTGGSWIDFSAADGGDYKGRIRHDNASGIFEFHANGSSSVNMSVGTSWMEMYGGVRADEYRINTTTVIDSSRNINGETITGYKVKTDRYSIASPRYDTSFFVMQSEHWYSHTGSDVMYLGESGNKVRNRGTLRVGSNADAESGYVLQASGSLKVNSDTNTVGSYQVNGTTVIDSARNATVNKVTATASGMSEFSTDLSSNDDWVNSPISIRERNMAGSTASADMYAPNLNFHWAARASNSLWMNSAGHLVYGTYSSTGVPAANGVFAAGAVRTNTLTDLSDTSTFLELEGDSLGMRLQTVNGYFRFGARNSTWCHMETDRSGFYFYKKINVVGTTNSTTGYQLNGTTVIDASRNLTPNVIDMGSGHAQGYKFHGRSYSWNSAMQSPTTKMPHIWQEDYSGWDPILGIKTTNGFWQTGAYSSNEIHNGYMAGAYGGHSTNAFDSSWSYTPSTFKIGNVGTMSLTVSGNITANGNITAYSDRRLKDNIKTLDGSKVYEMRGVSFTKDGELGSGVIAQELEQVAPELVLTNSDEMQTKSVAYGNVVGYLIEAIKELKLEIEELKNGNYTN